MLDALEQRADFLIVVTGGRLAARQKPHYALLSRRCRLIYHEGRERQRVWWFTDSGGAQAERSGSRRTGV